MDEKGASGTPDLTQAAAEAAAASVTAHRVLRDVEITADRDAIQARQGLSAWQRSQAAAVASGQMLARMRRAHELGDAGLADLLIAERQDFDVCRLELGARAGVHSAILQLMIDARRIWSLGDE